MINLISAVEAVQEDEDAMNAMHMSGYVTPPTGTSRNSLKKLPSTDIGSPKGHPMGQFSPCCSGSSMPSPQLGTPFEHSLDYAQMFMPNMELEDAPKQATMAPRHNSFYGSLSASGLCFSGGAGTAYSPLSQTRGSSSLAFTGERAPGHHQGGLVEGAQSVDLLISPDRSLFSHQFSPASLSPMEANPRKGFLQPPLMNRELPSSPYPGFARPPSASSPHPQGSPRQGTDAVVSTSTAQLVRNTAMGAAKLLNEDNNEKGVPQSQAETPIKVRESMGKDKMEEDSPSSEQDSHEGHHDEVEDEDHDEDHDEGQGIDDEDDEDFTPGKSKKRAISLRSGRTVYASPGASSLDRLSNAAAEAVPLPPKLVTAVYTSLQPSKTKAKGTKFTTGAPRDGVVMSATRREWQSTLGNTSISSSNDMIKGRVTAVGSVQAYDGDELRNFIVVQPDQDKVPQATPLLRIDIRRLTTVGHKIIGYDKPPQHAHDSVGPPLGRPSFSPYETGLVALATEHHPLQDSNGGVLVVAQVQRTPKPYVRLAAAALFIKDSVSAMDWLSAKELIVATGRDIIVVSLGDGVMRERLVMPSMHDDEIRDLQLSHHHRNLALSGGYDGKAFVTDCERVVSDQMSYRVHSSNSLYVAGKTSVSSVQWNPVVANLASITTDPGYFHCFDTRLGSDKQTIILNTGVHRLYTHGWADSNATMLGYGDGSIRFFDIRRPSHCVCTFKDPHVSQIGDIVFDPQRRFFVTFGSPGFSVWRNDSACLSLRNSDRNSYTAAQIDTDLHYKQSGAFLLTGGRQHAVFGTTDAHGFFSIYDVHSAGESAIDIK